MSPPPIIYVEDRDDDALFLRLALKKAGVLNPLIHLETLNTATEFFDDAFNSGRNLGVILVDQDLGCSSSKCLVHSIANRFPHIPLFEITGCNLIAESAQQGLGPPLSLNQGTSSVGQPWSIDSANSSKFTLSPRVWSQNQSSPDPDKSHFEETVL